MRKLTVLILILLLSLGVFGIAAAQADSLARIPPNTFIAWMTGAEEVPGPIDTDAIGLAAFVPTRSERALHFVVLVHNIENVTAAHIHCGPPGIAGPVGVTLFMGGPVTPGNVLSQGTIREPDPGNACDWASLADVLAAIRSGDAYVNVHTTAHPPGEIRGQIEPLSN